MYRSIFHARPLLNGYSGYWPRGFLERMETVARLPDADALASLRRATGIATIVVHLQDLSAPERSRWLALAEDERRADVRYVAREGEALVFEVGDHADVSWRSRAARVQSGPEILGTNS
jgi:hypothetical protein